MLIVQMAHAIVTAAMRAMPTQAAQNQTHVITLDAGQTLIAQMVHAIVIVVMRAILTQVVPNQTHVMV